jgi:hypothetical protein
LPVLQGVMFSTYGVIKYLEVTLIALVFVTWLLDSHVTHFMIRKVFTIC